MTTTENSGFRPFETMLDKPEVLSILKNTAAGADDCELFLERRKQETVIFDDGRVRNASFTAKEGFGLRAVKGEATGYAHSSEINEAAIGRASETARLAVGQGGGTLAPPPGRTNRRIYGDGNPVGEREFASLVGMLKEIDAFARDLDRRVVQATASITTSFQEIEILRPDGSSAKDSRPMSRVNVAVIAEENGRRETGSAATGGRIGLEELNGKNPWRDLVEEALRIARVNLEAVPAPAGEMDVVLGPGWPGVLLHEAVGHGLEGDFNRKKSSAFAGLMGKRVAAPGVTVIDDGTILDRRGSITIDDEGTPSQANTLIEDGILVNYLQDRQNARLVGVAPTGNGRRESYEHAPMPRMTNTFMQGADAEPEAVLAELTDGIYAVGFGGGQVDITNGKFVFNCTEAYRVKDGKIGAPVKNATLIGDGATALKRIRAVGNDLKLDPGIGLCGKNGQWVPVGVGLPTLLIGGLTVGGSAA
ncbi:MAG: metallopeptidase TldD-related protein [Albidovulum sp.]|nr:metallopeptidase TldD-related protein [Albidovulum sp.]MDE0532873.1 metallopeptidase TldD-related protein [Albidovulum sp.]